MTDDRTPKSPGASGFDADLRTAIDELVGFEAKSLERALEPEEQERRLDLGRRLFGSRTDERRRHFRVESERTARVESPEVETVARATSISAGGLFLELPDASQSLLGRELDVTVSLPSTQERTLRARVAVCRVVAPGGASAPGLGVRFVGLDSEQRILLLDYLRSHLLWLAEVSRQKYRVFFEHSADMAMLLSIDGGIREVSAEGGELLGVHPEKLVGARLEDIAIPEASDAVRVAVERARAGEKVRVALRFPRSDGSLVPVDLGLTPFWVEGLRLGTMVVGHDRRGRQELERQARVLERRLFQADKLATLGQVAAGIAHDINNPLAYVLSNLSLLQEYVDPILELLQHARNLGDSSPVACELLDRLAVELPGLVDDSIEGSRRVGELVRDLREFARVDNQAEVCIDVNQCLDSAERLTRNLTRHRARLVREYASHLPPTRCNFGRLSQVFLNLITNAVQSFDLSDVRHNQIRLATDLVDGKIQVHVSDNGRGIEVEVLDRLFEPFFTTRRAEGGTGLGLVIAKENTEALGGTLTVSSQPGAGATFTVTLPVRGATGHVAEDAPRHPPSSRTRVLVVDDDPILLRGLKRALSRSFEVTTTPSPSVALDLAGSTTFDVVLCDVMMPEMSGIEFHRRLQESRPGLARRTVFMTGGTFAAEEERCLERLANPIVRKPIPPSQLVETVAAIGATASTEESNG